MSDARIAGLSDDERNDGNGIYVVNEHENGYKTKYCHLSARMVAEGFDVRREDPIGEVGNTGESYGEHLYFEMSKLWCSPHIR